MTEMARGTAGEPASVAIVGAGPAGAALAGLLAQRGIAVALIERERDFERVFRGEGLMPSGIDALVAMGHGDLLRGLPARRLESWELHIDGEPIFAVREPAELGERAPRVLSQPALLAGLVAQASRSPSFSFLPGASVRDLVRDGGRCRGVRVATAEGEREIAADLVVGCDGRASLVRQRADLALDRLPESYDVLWFKMPAPERLRDGCAFYLMASRSHQAACYTSWDGRLQYALVLKKGTYAARRGVDWIAELARPAPAWLGEHVLSVRDRVEGPALLDVVVGRCPKWTAPGVLLLGDAAHPMAPIRAQGINLALRDAIVAANHLVPALRSRDAAAIDAAACRVQEEREPEVRRAQTLQHRDAAGWDSRFAPLLMAFAKRVGKRIGRYAWAQRAWLDAQRDLRFGIGEVRLTV
jgi:2-polyprenyl-6-methoxyphenol hydroxylase-like FAD-dependent oxidoreductase